MITTVSSDQGEILRNIMDLYHIQQFSADVTYGIGHNHSDQAHARKNHCYFLVFRKGNK